MQTDVSKTGCYIVIVIHSDGSKSIAYEWDEREDCSNAQFKSEKAAQRFIERAAISRPGVVYYSKYISWSPYD